MIDAPDAFTALLGASARVWRLADGRGAYASGTASGAPVRRGQALLVAPGPGGGPLTTLLRFDDRVTTGAGAAALELSPAFVANGHRGGPALAARAGALERLERFDESPWPTWRFRGEGFALERAFRMIEGHPALVASWTLLEGGPVSLAVAPLLAARAPGALQREPDGFRGTVSGIPGRVRVETRDGLAPVTLWHNGAFVPARAWQRGLLYPLDAGETPDPDAARAGALEDACVPGWAQATLERPGAALHVVVSTEEGLFRALAAEQRLGAPPARTLADCVAALDAAASASRAAWRRSVARGADFTARQAASAHGGEGEALARRRAPLITEQDALLSRLADALLDARLERPGRAGATSEWVTGLERGADTLRIAAALVSLRALEPARTIARGFLEYLDEGLAPESFAPDGRPRYGSPEASLWLVHLADLLARRGSADAGAADAFLREEAWPRLEGVLQHLRSGSRHGVHCDREGFLWCGEGARASARADLNALWYHALVAMAQLAKLVGRREHGAFYLAWARELQRAFAERFWDEACGALFDALAPDGPVRGLTPSQLLAASLPPALLPPERARRLLATLEREGLAGPHGDPEWLGAWTAATLRTERRSPEARARAQAAFDLLARRLETRGVASLSPVAAAELLRARIEDLDAGVATAARG